MNIEELLKLVAPEKHAEFEKFIRTGEASEQFLDYLDQDQNCQRAVSQAFELQAQAFEELADVLRAEPITPAGLTDVTLFNSGEIEAISMSIVSTITQVASLPPEKRELVVSNAARAMGAASTKQSIVKKLFQELLTTITPQTSEG